MDNKLKILHVVNVSSFGGIQKLVIELSEAINKKNTIECQILATRQVDISYEALPKNLTVIEVNKLGFFRKINKIFKTMKSADIIHLHGPYTFYQCIGIFVNRKIVYTEHSTLQKTNINNTIKHLIQKQIFGKLYLEYISAVIFISKWIKNDLALKNKNQFVIYNGLTYQEPKIEKHKDFVITIAARLVRKKRVHMAINLMHKLKDYPTIKLKIIGDGKELSNLKRTAGKLINETIFFLGYKQNAYDIIASSDIYIMTTDKEGFGLVILEAMMSETLVLALKDSRGPVEILQSNFPFLIVDDLEELTKSVLYWKNNPVRKRHVEKDLKSYYLDKFTIERMAREYSDVYMNLINNVKHD